MEPLEPDPLEPPFPDGLGILLQLSPPRSCDGIDCPPCEPRDVGACVGPVTPRFTGSDGRLIWRQSWFPPPCGTELFVEP